MSRLAYSTLLGARPPGDPSAIEPQQLAGDRPFVSSPESSQPPIPGRIRHPSRRRHWEMTWSFNGPDGRATFEWIAIDGELGLR
jgi:hypothetical protein